MSEFQAISDVSFSIPSIWLWLVWAFFALIAGIMSAVLFYHWKKYGSGSKTIAFVETLHLVVVLGLLAVSAISIALF